MPTFPTDSNSPTTFITTIVRQPRLDDTIAMTRQLGHDNNDKTTTTRQPQQDKDKSTKTTKTGQPLPDNHG